MSLLTTVNDVCMACGLNPPISMFGTSIQPRTQAELLSLANEMAQRIAYDVREWTALKLVQTFTSTGGVTNADNSVSYAMPANFKRMLLTTQVYSSQTPRLPMVFVADTDEWLARRISNYPGGWGEWTMIGNNMVIYPALAAGHSISFVYLDKNCVGLYGGGYGDTFANDADVFRIPERLLKLGMIWQWKANKGSPYAEDMGTYSDALVNVAGADKPAPIIVGRLPASANVPVAYPWPVPTP
jgi:hypothetical protein